MFFQIYPGIPSAVRPHRAGPLHKKQITILQAGMQFKKMQMYTLHG